jgi:hypothetical protein
MAFGDKALDYIERKKTGMIALMQNLAGHAEGEMKTRAPWRDRTSHAKGGLHAGVEIREDKYVLFLAHSMEYGIYLEEGTPPHIITPKRKKALYWVGAKHPVKQVKHPGTKAYPIVRPTSERYKDKLRNAILDWWSK